MRYPVSSVHALYIGNHGAVYVRPDGLPALMGENVAALSARFYADIIAAKALKTARVVDTRKTAPVDALVDVIDEVFMLDAINGYSCWDGIGGVPKRETIVVVEPKPVAELVAA
jgi:hypothetical protein